MRPGESTLDLPAGSRDRWGRSRAGRRRHEATVGLSILPAFIVLALWPGPVLARPGGFDRDGHDDLAIGVPYEDISTIVDAGAVNVIHGTGAGGLSASGDQFWDQDETGVLDTSETADFFGVALAAGDFDGDGYLDLAVGVPYEDVGDATDAGAVHVLYGSGAGLSATGDQVFHQDVVSVEGAAEEGDAFGTSLAVGDFNGDGRDDLAVGVPWEDVGTMDHAGCVNVLYGSGVGLSATGDQLWHQDASDIQGTAEPGDQFGYSLAAGDFNRDGYDDLAVGVVNEAVGSTVGVGAVNIIYGSADGLAAAGNEWFHQDTTGILDVCETDDGFGWALAAGDLNGDGHDDLAVGVPGEDFAGKDDVGAVNVLYGSGAGLGVTGDQFWHQDVVGAANGAEEGDRFGRVLTAGDFNGDGRADLAVGIPYEDNGSTEDTGAVHVFYGSSSGLTTAGNLWFMQNTAGMLDSAEAYDYFGRALASGDFNGDRYADLAIGVPYEDVGSVDNAGAVSVVYGSSGGLTTAGNQFWHQDVPQVEGACEPGDRFGYALASTPWIHREDAKVPVGPYQLLLLGD